jgi:hypothetical protein
MGKWIKITFSPIILLLRPHRCQRGSNPIVVAEPVQHRPDPVMLQISLKVFLEILLLSEEEVPYCRVSLREECIIIPFGDFLNHALQVMIGKKAAIIKRVLLLNYLFLNYLFLDYLRRSRQISPSRASTIAHTKKLAIR